MEPQQQQHLNTSTGGPSSVPTPSSVSSALGGSAFAHTQYHGLTSQSSTAPSSALAPPPLSVNEADPIAAAKVLILRDLRKTLMVFFI